MPGIDYNKLRAEIKMEDVLRLMGFEPTSRRGNQWYGGCPMDRSTFRRPRHFSVNVANRRYYCHRCHSKGNQLELWAAVTKLPFRQSTIHLCHMLGREVPWIRRW